MKSLHFSYILLFVLCLFLFSFVRCVSVYFHRSEEKVEITLPAADVEAEFFKFRSRSWTLALNSIREKDKFPR